MPEEQEIGTSELQEAIDELHHDRQEREQEEARTKWTKYVGLATAIFAVFAALGALESGSLVNEAMIARLQASDKWSEYQADKDKVHGDERGAYPLLDSGAKVQKLPKGVKNVSPMTPSQRLAFYLGDIDRETEKTAELSKEAKKLEGESEALLDKHHQFAFSVTGIQVAIALGAVAAMTKMKWVWFVSLIFGLAGIVLFAKGLL